MKKKELNEKELAKVNGGIQDLQLECPYCFSFYDMWNFETREIGEDCDKETEYQCPDCKRWFKEGRTFVNV